MGDMADDMMRGMTCSECGTFFMDEDGNIDEHGYPVLCVDCHRHAGNTMIPKATMMVYMEDE